MSPVVVSGSCRVVAADDSSGGPVTVATGLELAPSEVVGTVPEVVELPPVVAVVVKLSCRSDQAFARHPEDMNASR